MLDQELVDLFHAEFQRGLAERLAETGTPLDQWRAGGRRSKAYPDKENADWWTDHGPKMVVAYAEWRRRMQEHGWQIWWAPGGVPAIELDLMVTFGDIPVRMVIDRVFVSPHGELAVIDLKAGARDPDSVLQLDFYKAGLEKAFDVSVTYGSYYMARKAELTGLIELTTSAAQLTRELELFNLAVTNEIFIPHRGSHCTNCGVNRACAAFGGSEAHLYDVLHPDYGKDNT